MVEGSPSLNESIKNTQIIMLYLQRGQQNSFQDIHLTVSPYLNMSP